MSNSVNFKEIAVGLRRQLDFCEKVKADLLVALEEASLLLRTKRHACENPEVCHVLDTHIARISAAIAKARGQS